MLQTNYARKLFTTLVDVNWELSQVKEKKYSKNIEDALVTQYNKVLDELKKEMGEEDYEAFIIMGKMMFAEKEVDNQDENKNSVNDELPTYEELTENGEFIENTLDGTVALYEYNGVRYVILADNTVITQEEDNLHGSEDALFPL